MRANTAVQPTIPPTERVPPAPAAVVAAARGRKLHLFAALSDRRPLRQIGGVSAYLRQVRWSLWWALRDGSSR